MRVFKKFETIGWYLFFFSAPNLLARDLITIAVKITTAKFIAMEGGKAKERTSMAVGRMVKNVPTETFCGTYIYIYIRVLL